MDRKLKSFHEFTKMNENLEFEETKDQNSNSTPVDEDLDFGEGEKASTSETSTPEAPKPATEGNDKEVKNDELVSKLNHMIGILNSHRNFLKTQDADENLAKKVNDLFAVFNKY